MYKNGDDLKWDPEQYRSLVIICTKAKKSGQNMEYINILIGKKYVRRGFFLTFYKRVEKNIFRAGFLEVPITLT